MVASGGWWQRGGAEYGDVAPCVGRGLKLDVGANLVSIDGESDCSVDKGSIVCPSDGTKHSDRYTCIQVGRRVMIGKRRTWKSKKYPPVKSKVIVDVAFPDPEVVEVNSLDMPKTTRRAMNIRPEQMYIVDGAYLVQQQTSHSLRPLRMWTGLTHERHWESI